MSRRKYSNHPLENEIFKQGYSSIQTFCDKAQIDKSTLYYYFSGNTKHLTGYTLYRLSEALHLPYTVVKSMCEVRPNDILN